MHAAVPPCHTDVASHANFAPNVSETTPPGPVPGAQQWVSTTLGRVVTDTYSWLQAVHWVHGAGIAVVPPKGPKFGPTTIRIAQELTKLTEVRPGVEYLMRVLKLSERTVQYHLAHLRRTGLLAYVEVGTRLPRTEDRGVVRRTSHFALTVPQAFDVALGIRTAGEGPARRMTGIAEAGRETIARLGKLASKAVRRRKKARSQRERRCTPMVGGSPLPSLPNSPSASRLEGEGRIRKVKKGNCGPVRNRVARRFQLAAELRKRVLWLCAARGNQRQAVERLAWVLQDVSDAGWSVDEVEAWLALIEEPEHVRRPSGLVASRLRTALLMWSTPDSRALGVETYRSHLQLKVRARARINPNVLSPGSVASGVAVQIVARLRGGQVRLAAGQRDRGLDDLSGGASTGFGTSDEAVDARFAAFLGGAL